MTLSRNQKYQEKERLYEEQEGRCKHCERSFAISDLEIDHIEPTSEGGPDIPSNWQLLCSRHNRKKSNLPDSEARARVEEEAKEAPDMVDFRDLASTLMLDIVKSDDGHYVLTNGICHVQSDEPCGYPNPEVPPTKTCLKAVPFTRVVFINGMPRNCEVRCFSSMFWDIRPRGKWEQKIARFYGLALPHDDVESIIERHASVKVEYSVSMPANKGLMRWGEYSFYLDREMLLSVLKGRKVNVEAHCDTIRRSEDPAKNTKFYQK